MEVFPKLEVRSTVLGQCLDVEGAENYDFEENSKETEDPGDANIPDTYQAAEDSKLPSFSDNLQFLYHPHHHLLDAYPVLSKVYHSRHPC